MPLKPPPRDSDDKVLPHDHQGIGATDGLIRRVHNLQTVHDEKINGRRLSSLVFKASSDANAGMSVDLQTQIEEAGLDTKLYVTTPKWVGSIRFTAGDVRGLCFQVGYSPTLDNPHHGEVWGKYTNERQKKLRACCTWLVPIKGVEIG